jgi:hypothetical protein
MQCLYRKLNALLLRLQDVGLLEHSIIVMHGDHGSRLGLHDPIDASPAGVEPGDYTDNFSVLYAVRRPGQPGGYDRSIHALETLVADTLELPLDIRTNTHQFDREFFVYLRPKENGSMVKVPYLPPIGP